MRPFPEKGSAMNRLTLLAIAAAAASPGAAATAAEPPSQHHNTSLYSVNQPVVERTDYVFDVAGGSVGLAPGELGRLDGWFASLGLQYGDRVYVDASRTYGAAGARTDIAALAGRYGMLLSEGAPVTTGAVEAGTLRVVVSRSFAYVPGCPQWDPQEIGARLSISPNFGCATNSNLAAMIADPNDLVLGRTGGGVDPKGEMSNRALKAYRGLSPSGAGGSLKTESVKGN